ncbi:MAG: hypothetical protein JXC36_05365 [Candidatus Atribacteria bacterium]|nr:hypothetical protein [Candidatus Atribacteria bacterium]
MKRNILFVVTVVLLICLTVPVFANNDMEINGVLNSRFDLEFDSVNIDPFINGTLELTIANEIASDSFFKLEAELSTQKEQILRIKEAFLDFYFKSTDLRLGQQRIAWGKADGINPTDHFNPVDYTRPFAEENRIEIPALRLKHYRNDWIIDMVWAPFFIPSKFPEPGSRWLSNGGQMPSLPSGYELNDFKVEPLIEPEFNLENSEYGIRISRWSGTIDASMSYFHGWQKEPVSHINMIPLNAGLMDLIIEPAYHIIDVIGGDFSKDFVDYVVRGEAAYIIPEEEHVRNPYLSYVIGFDTYISDKSYINIQLFGEKESEKKNKLGLTVAYQYDLSDYSQMEINGVYHFSDNDFLINPKYSREMSDDFSFSIGAYLFFGKEGTELGQLSDKDFMFIELKKTF